MKFAIEKVHYKINFRMQCNLPIQFFPLYRNNWKVKVAVHCPRQRLQPGQDTIINTINLKNKTIVKINKIVFILIWYSTWYVHCQK